MAVHYYNRSGTWIAFRRFESDEFLFNTSGNSVGRFPWRDDDAVDTHGNYLGSVISNRFLHRKFSAGLRDPSTIAFPSNPGHPGYPSGGVGHFGYDSNLEDIPPGKF
jgi:hypothetical protein